MSQSGCNLCRVTEDTIRPAIRCGWHRKMRPVLNDHSDFASQETGFKDLYLREIAPPHPGEVLREDIVPALDISRTALARSLGISGHKLRNLLTEQCPITVDLALRLGTVLGHGARYWLGLQMQYDIWLARQPTAITLKPLAWRKPPSAHAA